MSELAPIPKYLHLTCTRLDALPHFVIANLERFASMNPGWRITLYDDAAIERYMALQSDARLAAAFRRLNPDYGAARADLFRYARIWAVGGVYLDIKSAILRPMEQILKPRDSLLLSHWDEAHLGWGRHPEIADLDDGEFQQWHIVSAPRNRLIRAVIDRCIAGIEQYSVRQTGVGRQGVLRLTGPICYTRGILGVARPGDFRLIRARDEGFQYRSPEAVEGGTFYSRSQQHYSMLTAPIVIDSRP